jgi:hypothetical protein
MQTLSTFDEKLATILFNELTTTPQTICVHRTAFDKLRLRRGAHLIDFVMKTEKLHEGWRALWFAIAGVMAIMLIWNVIIFSLS